MRPSTNGLRCAVPAATPSTGTVQFWSLHGKDSPCDRAQAVGRSPIVFVLRSTFIRDRYRVARELSSTLYGRVVVCETPQDKHKSSLAAFTTPSVVMKQVCLKRMANVIRDLPTDGHIPDNPMVEKEVGDLLRAAGGHPNVVQYKDSFVEQQTLHLVMEHCADGDLYDYLSRRKQRTMSCMNALSVLSQVATGLEFLHKHGIAHRDISLENIMLHRGRCKIGDFGLATRARRVSGRRVGKEYYMAPEIVAGETYDPKAADVWSLGIVLFIMLTGSPLVSLASTSVKAFRTLKQAGIKVLMQAWGMTHVSDSALQLLAGMLETDPEKRLTVAQVLEHEALNSDRDSSSYSANKAVAVEAPLKQAVQRTGLGFVLSDEGVQFTDLAFVQEVRRRVAELKTSAAATESKSNNTRLAQRTLKYRRIA
ncbi:hypothetical protein ON010_g2708 [Phytophthora cinnamomi]|nr:hypothetical protein ON010_g2708 [Phytophthora cinnamomi]